MKYDRFYLKMRLVSYYFSVSMLSGYCLIPLQAVLSDSLEQAVVHSPELNEKLKTAYKNKGSSYKPRTEHLNSDGSAKYTNRLILEDSPYLIQHAHNPVNWYAWGNEAFEKAKRENKPIFLSIGYSTCHWCHVMERESFDNELIAEYLNQHFVAIKVDRERRPDVDKIYMTALMMVNGSGGWPMSSILTPEGSPFFSGTYLPPEMFMDVLKRATDLWQSQETQVRQIAEKITSLVQSRQWGLKLAEHIGKERVAIAVISLLNRFDELQGGFSLAPKFPNETYLFLLMDNVIREQDQDALNALKLTLDMMAQGGIYDQIGGGFHRYSTDNEWLTPHFEKMLYNQAHLARNYLQLFNVTHDMSYQRVVTQTLDYVLREMQADNGGFYSASDADTEGEEGKYFLWTPEEIQSVLSPELAKLAIALYGVTKTGNFIEHPVNETLVSDKLGSNILNLPVSIKEFSLSSKEFSEQNLNTLYQKVDQIRQQLYQYRTSRIAPAIDRKVVTAWNGMMITTLAQAGEQLQKQNYIDVAIKVAEFLWQTHHYTVASNSETKGSLSSSGLYRASLDGKASVSAIQADYAYLAQGYLALYDVTSNRVWLERSEQLVKEMIRLFWDKEEAGFYMTAVVQDEAQEPVLFERPKDTSDGALPSGNAVALEVLSQLYFRTGKDYYHTKAMAMIASMSAIIKTSPVAFSYFLMAVNQLNFGETGNTQYGGKGHVRIEQQLLSHQFTNNKHQLELNFKIDIDKGWHINSRYPLDEELIATSVSLGKSAGKHWKITRVVYPQGEELQLKFNDTPLSLYQNTVNIKVLIESDNSLTKTDGEVMMNTLPVQINYQSCSDSICLAPEEHRFTLFL